MTCPFIGSPCPLMIDTRKAAAKILYEATITGREPSALTGNYKLRITETKLFVSACDRVP